MKCEWKPHSVQHAGTRLSTRHIHFFVTEWLAENLLYWWFRAVQRLPFLKHNLCRSLTAPYKHDSIQVWYTVDANDTKWVHSVKWCSIKQWFQTSILCPYYTAFFILLTLMLSSSGTCTDIEFCLLITLHSIIDNILLRGSTCKATEVWSLAGDIFFISTNMVLKTIHACIACCYVVCCVWCET